jgi:hypothetical protein
VGGVAHARVKFDLSSPYSGRIPELLQDIA